MDNNLLLKIKKLDKKFPGVHALKGVDLNIYPGEVHALMGENGAGKSTLIKVLTGIHPKNAGTIEFNGEEIDVKSPIEAGEKGISTIYQELNLVPYQSVYENMFLGREPTTRYGTVNKKEMILGTEKILSELGINIDVTKQLGSYGTAIQQMVAIGRAISIKAKLVIMDEPTSSLDSKEVSVLFKIIKQLKEKGIAIIFISHRLDEIFEICDRLTIFKDGEYIGEYNVSELNQLQLISLMIGKEGVKLERKKKGYKFTHSPEVISVKNINQGRRLNGIDVNIKQGEILGLAGLLGSGRTELAKVIFGEEAPNEGEIFWWGEETLMKSPRTAIKNGIGFCTEDRKVEGIIPHMSVKENMTIALLPKISKFGFVLKKQQTEIVEEYIHKLKIKTPNADQQIKNLSGGNQQKVLLARWLCMNPQLIIMDEPTRGIDVGAKSEIEDLIQELSEKGISVLMISSELSELERNCDRVIVMREGKKAGELVGDSISDKRIMETIAEG